MANSLKPLRSVECFPRTATLPTQSANYWVEQKDRYLRQQLISDIEADTERLLIVYFTSSSFTGFIDGNDDRYLCDLISNLDLTKPVDLLLESPGGEVEAAHKLVHLLKTSISDLRVIVPHRVKSAGTILALTGKEIVMGHVSELGPADPFLHGIPACHLVSPELQESVDAITREMARSAIQKCHTLVETLLVKHCPNLNEEQRSDLALTLTTNWQIKTHGTPINYRQAKDMGLSINFLDYDNELWKKYWLLYCMYEYDCVQKGLSKIFESAYLSYAIVPASNDT